MAKLDVGVGDEFPIDETKPDKPRGDAPDGKSGETRGEAERDAGPCEWGGREWREHRNEWRRRWRDHHHADGRGHSRTWRNNDARKILAALFIIGAIALIIAIISHFFYFILGAAVLAALYVMHERHHGDWDFGPRVPSREQN
jgi:hypothetical protein